MKSPSGSRGIDRMISKLGRPFATDAGLATSFSRLDGNVFVGFALDPGDLSRRFTIELMIDGIVIETAYAENYTPELVEQGFGDGCFGFVFILTPAILLDAQTAE